METILIWTIVSFFVAGLAYEEPNPYVEAIRARPWKSVHRYVEVRPGAHLFYWLYYADGTSLKATSKPLVIWIQGGPGFAASGIANFAEIGPLTMDMTPRNHTWVNGRNVLLIDHPVGTGFSYVTDKSLLVKTDRNMAIDLSRAIKAFYRRHKEFRKTPTYIFGQSYGGKICPRLAYYLHTAIEKKSLKMNFKGIGIGSGWVDPKESTLIYPEYLYNMENIARKPVLFNFEACIVSTFHYDSCGDGLTPLHTGQSFDTGVIDQNTYLKSLNMARKMAKYMDKKDYIKAGSIHEDIIQVIMEESGMNINFNNINQESPYPALGELSVKVNKYVKPTLIVNQSLEWNFMAEEIWYNLNQSFLVPSTKFLEMLLNSTKLKIAVYNGNLDIVTPLAGASNWVHKLKWPGAQEFKDAKRIQINGHKNGFYKKSKQLSFWCVFKSGHWVPEDNPEAMEQILDHVTLESL